MFKAVPEDSEVGSQTNQGLEFRLQPSSSHLHRKRNEENTDNLSQRTRGQINRERMLLANDLEGITSNLMRIS